MEISEEVIANARIYNHLDIALIADKYGVKDETIAEIIYNRARYKPKPIAWQYYNKLILNPSMFYKEHRLKSGYVVYYISNYVVGQQDLIMEDILLRKLKRGEIVHHINGIKNDNNPYNLRIIPDRGTHTKIHKRFVDIAYKLLGLGIIIFKDGEYNINEDVINNLQGGHFGII